LFTSKNSPLCGPSIWSCDVFDSSSKVAAAAAAAPAANEAKQVKADAPKSKKPEDSDEEDDGEDVADMPVAAAPVPKGKPRRVSVSAESMDPAKLKAQMSQVTDIPKSPEITANLLAVVGKSPLLRMLEDEQKDMIVKAFSGPISKAAGENIIVQGDIGDVFYLLEEGLVDVYIKKAGNEIKVHTYKPGDAFGELAIMYNAPRAATCRAQVPCKLWALDRVSFKVIVVAAAMQKRETYKGFLEKVPLLESLTEMEIMTLADSLAEEKYSDGQAICLQGDAGDYFYIVKEGTAVCYQADSNGGQKVVATLTGGQYFGEIALLTSKPRQATVKAQGQLVVLAVDRATFTRVFGSMDEILKRNMEQYNKYAASTI
jgi:cAMP-dependent protein kinase regulator